MLHTIEGVEVEFGAKRSLRNRQSDIGDEIEFFTTPALMRSHTQVHIEVTFVSPARADGATTSQSKRLAAVDACGNLDGDRHLFHHATFSTTRCTRRRDLLTGATATTAGSSRDHLTEHALTHPTFATRAVAVGAGLWHSAAGGTRAIAVVAAHSRAHTHLAL